MGADGVVVSMLALHAGDPVQVLVTAQIQNRNDVPQQFGSCLKWRSQAYKIEERDDL